MIDIEKLRNGLEHCIANEDCHGCPYFLYDDSPCGLNTDSLALLDKYEKILETKSWQYATLKIKNNGTVRINKRYITAYGYIEKEDMTVVGILGESKEIYFPGDQTHEIEGGEA